MTEQEILDLGWTNHEVKTKWYRPPTLFKDKFFTYGNLIAGIKDRGFLITVKDPALADNNFAIERFFPQSLEELKLLMPYLQKYIVGIEGEKYKVTIKGNFLSQ